MFYTLIKHGFFYQSGRAQGSFYILIENRGLEQSIAERDNLDEQPDFQSA